MVKRDSFGSDGWLPNHYRLLSILCANDVLLNNMSVWKRVCVGTPKHVQTADVVYQLFAVSVSNGALESKVAPIRFTNHQ